MKRGNQGALVTGPGGRRYRLIAAIVSGRLGDAPVAWRCQEVDTEGRPAGGLHVYPADQLTPRSEQTELALEE